MTVDYPATFRSMQIAMRCLVVLAMPGLSFGLVAQLKPVQLRGGGYLALGVIFWGVNSALHPGRPATS